MKENWNPPSDWGNTALKEFEEVSTPEPVSFFPETSAWLWLVGLVALIAVIQVWKKLRIWIRNHYRREAISQLDLLKLQSAFDQLPALLKRTAMLAYGRETVASLHGEEWLDFLNNNCPHIPFKEDTGQLLLEVSYGRNNPDLDGSILEDTIKFWILNHNFPEKE